MYSDPRLLLAGGRKSFARSVFAKGWPGEEQMGCWALELDWLKIGAVLQGVGGIMQGLGAGFLVWITWRGVSAWREELRSKRKQELAEEALSLVYRVVDGVHHMRSAFVSAAEMNAVPRPEKISDEDFDMLKMYLAVQRRFAQHEKAHGDLLAIRYRVAAVFGADTRKQIEALLTVVREVQNATGPGYHAERELKQWQDWRPQVGRPDRADIADKISSAQARWDKQNRVLFAIDDEDDEIASRMKVVVSELERHLVPSAQLADRVIASSS
ncbi:hypothetical protein [Xanthomonas sacchari]|uniref:hypothetical protein n=1 Tax=Xanthomonas sacchari TaxID=56458 RepID=UPI00224E170A|nr:hypothetical protein [Xanthomonas sacchari]